MKNLIYIDHEPLTFRRKKIFYLEELQKVGFHIEFWDCSQFFHPGMWLPDIIEETYVLKFCCLTDIEHGLIHTNLSNTLFIVEVLDWWNNRNFFHLLAQYNCYTIRQDMYATALLTEVSSIKKIFKIPISDLFNIMVDRFKLIWYKQYKKYYNIHYNLKISSGNKSDIDIHLNHPDWEISQNIIEELDIIDSPYALFIDECFPIHPDLIFFYKQQSGDVKYYHHLLNIFFKKIEKKYALEVIIAAHPKSNYDINCFEGRKIIKGKTVQLVKNAQMVFMHTSAALSFIIIFNKPIMLISTNAYERTSILYRNMIRISSLIRIPIYNIEIEKKINEVNKIEKKIREKYIYTYLTSKGIENKKNVDILYNTFRQL